VTASDADGGSWFEELWREQYDILTRRLRSQGASPADAADAAQEAYIQLWRNRAQVRHPRAYLYRVAWHALVRVWQKRQGFDILQAPVPLDTGGGVPARLQADMVLRQLLALPAQQRAVLAGRYDGYRDTDLAQVLGLTAATIRSHRRHTRATANWLARALEQDSRGMMLRRAYADMREGDPCPPGSRPVIAGSWTRSAQHLPDPGHSPALPLLGDRELAERRAGSPMAEIGRSLCTSLASSTGLLTVAADRDGRVLWRAGDRGALLRGEKDGHGDGACLAEHAVGTSGVSLALAARHPVAVCGAEHYCPDQHDLVCVGAPLYHPLGGRLIGAVCISAPWPAAHRDMLKVVDEAVRRVHCQLASESRVESR
jgi:DNA-directed RNA polymerase specialized sigma24 family protein